MSDFHINSETGIGHVHLKVSDLERAEAFYVGVLGMNVKARVPGALFVSFGDYHHDIGLNTWRSAGGPPPPEGTTGLFHFAIRVPTRKDLARVVKRLIDSGVPLGGASDHGVSEAIYLNDPDGNGIEIYRDRDRSEWKWNGDQVEMGTDPLDMKSLLAELD